MKIKRSSSQKQVNKWTRLGIGLLAVAVLGGVVAPVGGQLLNTPNTVYAQEQENAIVDVISFDDDSRDEIGRRRVTIKPGETVEILPDEIAGYRFIKKYVDKVILSYDEVLEHRLYMIVPYYYVAEQPVETPVEQPTEQPAEQPVETPTETKPSDTKPSASSSSTSPSSTSQSSATNPSASSSSASQSSASKPDETKPTETKVTEDQVSTSPVYRLYHEDLKVHLYTRDAHEYKVLSGRGWRQEGQAFLSASQGSPVYRLYHEGLKVHLYTRDAHEYKVLASRGWRQEGTAFYSVTDGTPVYRLYNEGLQKHLYTTDTNEYKVLATRGWTQEGVAFYSAK